MLGPLGVSPGPVSSIRSSGWRGHSAARGHEGPLAGETPGWFSGCAAVRSLKDRFPMPPHLGANRCVQHHCVRADRGRARPEQPLPPGRPCMEGSGSACKPAGGRLGLPGCPPTGPCRRPGSRRPRPQRPRGPGVGLTHEGCGSHLHPGSSRELSSGIQSPLIIQLKVFD